MRSSTSVIPKRKDTMGLPLIARSDWNTSLVSGCFGSLYRQDRQESKRFWKFCGTLWKGKGQGGSMFAVLPTGLHQECPQRPWQSQRPRCRFVERLWRLETRRLRRMTESTNRTEGMLTVLCFPKTFRRIIVASMASLNEAIGATIIRSPSPPMSERTSYVAHRVSWIEGDVKECVGGRIPRRHWELRVVGGAIFEGGVLVLVRHPVVALTTFLVFRRQLTLQKPPVRPQSPLHRLERRRFPLGSF